MKSKAFWTLLIFVSFMMLSDGYSNDGTRQEQLKEKLLKDERINELYDKLSPEQKEQLAVEFQPLFDQFFTKLKTEEMPLEEMERVFVQIFYSHMRYRAYMLLTRNTSWERTTSWLRPRPNPFRSSLSDISYRGRRHPFARPDQFTGKKPVKKSVTVNQVNARFISGKEREFKNIQTAYNNANYLKVVLLSRKFLSELGQAKVDAENEERKQELLVQVKAWRNKARENIETEGMNNVNLNLTALKQAFDEDDFEKVKELGDKIKTFVSTWDFSRADRRKKAETQQKEAVELMRRSSLREEFSKITINISFRIVSRDNSIPSSASINGKSVTEGDSLTENLIVKKIKKTSILFAFKGELIEYDIE